MWLLMPDIFLPLVRYEAEFLEDMAALGCRQPDVLTRVR